MDQLVNDRHEASSENFEDVEVEKLLQHFLMTIIESSRKLFGKLSRSLNGGTLYLVGRVWLRTDHQLLSLRRVMKKKIHEEIPTCVVNSTVKIWVKSHKMW